MTNTTLKDHDARRSIVQDLQTSILVEAGAGSGKTYSLIERMVALIKEGICTVDKLAAVTFTRKAAAELKGRFQLALEKALASETDRDKKERLSAALTGLDRCFLGTIHSFCAALLRERPIEAGLDPDFVELEDLEDALLRERAWDDYLVRMQADRPEVIEGLAEIDVEAGDLQDCYKVLATYPDVEIVREYAPKPDLEPVRKELINLLDSAKDVLPKTVPGGGWDGLQKILRRALRWRGVFDLENDLMLLRLLGVLNKSGGITQKRWLSPEDAKTIKKAFDGFRETYIVPTLEVWHEHRHKQLVDFVLPAVELYGQRRMEQSKLNYQDLLMHAAALLRENPEVRRYFRARYSHLLVDEFQDTDPIQAQIMFYLTGQEIDERDWRKLTPYPGSLFVVGDPKQAIYRFRRADIDTYNEVKRLIENSGGKILYLTTNFRSLQDIGDWVNPVFKELLPEKADSYQAAFTSMDTVRQNINGKAYGVKTITIPKIKSNRRDQIAFIDAGRIARWIRWAVDGGISLCRTDSELEAGLTDNPRPEDFMILLRYKAHMDLYARALEEQGIPFRIAGGDGFSNSAEMAEVIKILRVIIDPDDPVLLVAALRGSLFGISDNQLWLFKQAGGRFNIYSDVPSGLDDDDKEIFEWAFTMFRNFREWTITLPASAAMQNIVRELGIISHALTGELGKSCSGHLLQFQEFIAAAERSGITSFYSLVEYLTLLMESGVEEEINITPWEDNAVRLMNLHKAKGLEAPVVFLANPGKNVKWLPTMHINRVGDSTPRGTSLSKSKSHLTKRPWGNP